MSLMDYFPGTPRGEQENVINTIDRVFNDDGKKFVICQAPTGSGKSHIGATLMRSTRKAPKEFINATVTPKSHFNKDVSDVDRFGGFVLTTTKQLQDQYQSLFPECSILKGKVNYMCDLDPISNAGYARCVYIPKIMTKCSHHGRCEYINAYSDAVKNNFSVLSYSMFLTLPAKLRSKQILVCDEASELEDTLVTHFTINVSYKHLDYLDVFYSKLKSDNSESGFLWISDLMENLKCAMPPMKSFIRGDMSKADVDRANGIKKLLDKVKLIHKFWNESEFIIELTPKSVVISPLRINKLANIMFRGVDKVILLSATVINHVKMANSLGISSDEYEFINVKSDFDPKKSPIYTAPATFDMRYGHIDKSMSKMIDSVLELAEIHKDDNGLIHTHNFKITKALQDATIGDDRFLFRDKFATNEDILYEHYNTKEPTILVSPSLAFGTSLDNEHGRFQIISKLPYLPMSDKRIKILSSRDFEWYQMKMWIKLIQMCGRCTRSIDDHSSTYIFDKSFISAIKRYNSKLPDWFKYRLV
jgi:Rad3-related DNA helicase